MDSELQKLESQLREMNPSALDDALLDRLVGGIDGSDATLDPELRTIEASVSKLRPAALDEALSARLDAVVAKVPFPVDEKVVLFPGAPGPVEKKPRVARTRRYAAAAAVALAGGLSALMLSPSSDDAGKVAKDNRRPVPVAAPAQGQSGAFMPASFGSGVSDADDLGVMWSGESKPVRVVRVVYRDVVRFLNEKGEEVEVEVPRVEYLMAPEEID